MKRVAIAVLLLAVLGVAACGDRRGTGGPDPTARMLFEQQDRALREGDTGAFNATIQGILQLERTPALYEALEARLLREASDDDAGMPDDRPPSVFYGNLRLSTLDKEFA